eukprot:CAMPEP_0183303772 /NCGR_PEP_ID=MMETSP0160_2-20130417/9096_1 /TAXON_ID=2839 ORGANISM="Odontella Sinensis, Strain Grunow 1884" /NCGR_SAMPLE_ID=MMETSP0160_2 /ASSEMBLY_ACC=CAM_ASM_000250 /LENGTH=38 /DNA_ID= /DNA_START= /DNA_END= /DNA_ORIENTATION=
MTVNAPSRWGPPLRRPRFEDKEYSEPDRLSDDELSNSS